MGCAAWGPKLTDWILSELSEAEAQAVEGHVSHCADCARAVSEMRAVHGKLAEGLTDVAMPARLVFLNERPKPSPAVYFGNLWRAAATGAVAGVVFLVVAWSGLLYRGAPAVRPGRTAEAALTRGEVKALAAQLVADQLAAEQREQEATRTKLVENAANLTQLTRQVAYLQSIQSAEWERTEQQGALVQLMARNSVERVLPPASKP